VPSFRTSAALINSGTAETVVCSVSPGEHGNHTNLPMA